MMHLPLKNPQQNPNTYLLNFRIPVDRGAVITYVQCGRHTGVFTALSAVKCAWTIDLQCSITVVGFFLEVSHIGPSYPLNNYLFLYAAIV